MAKKAEILAEGIHFGECPRWREGRLWFSDMMAQEIKSVSLSGDVRVEIKLADDRPGGIGWMPDASLLVVSVGQRKVLRYSPDGEVRVHADLSNLAIYNLNDMVVSASGHAYVGDMGFDIGAEEAKRGREAVLADHVTAGLIHITPEGAASVAFEDMHFPNGMVITPDGNTLIVAESMALRLTAFDISADGSLSNRRVWAETRSRMPDGIALNADGAVWFASPYTGDCALIREGGEVLDDVATNGNCFACELGGEDGQTLFMTVNNPAAMMADGGAHANISIARV